MRNSKCGAALDCAGHPSGQDAQSIFDQTGQRTAVRTFDYFSEIKDSRLFLRKVVPEIKQIKQFKRGRTLSGPPDLSQDTRGRAPDMKSNSFDFIQTEPRQSAEFLIFNQKFLFKGDNENTERR